MIKTKIIFNTLLIILILYFIIEYFKPYMKVKNNKLDNMIKKVKKKIKEIKKIENDEDENIELDDDDEKVEVKEKFTNNQTNKTREHELTLYMEDREAILNIAKVNGFEIVKIINMKDCGYHYQYLYILRLQ